MSADHRSFGIKTLLITMAVIALWFSTASGYAYGRDVRAVILLTALLSMLFAAVYSNGAKRAFRIAFLAFTLVCLSEIKLDFVPPLRFDREASRWAKALTKDIEPSKRQGREMELFLMINSSLRMLAILPFAALSGLVAVNIYRRSHRQTFSSDPPEIHPSGHP